MQESIEMSYEEFAQMTTRIATENEISEDLVSLPKLHLYYSFLCRMLKVNQVINLTAIRDMENSIWKHLVDSLTIATYIPRNARVLDLGCGGGFPSIPLAIAREDISVTPLDSTAKKVQFVQEAAHELGLKNVSTLVGRAEEVGRMPVYREQFDVVVSRAVARLNLLDELALPLVKVGGRLIAMKGEQGEIELAEALKGFDKLGSQLETTETLQLKNDGQYETRTIIVVKKMVCSKPEHPRTWGQISKKPL